MLRVLERACYGGTIIGLDLFSEGLVYARQRTSCHLIQGDIHVAPFAKQFDIIGLFDVLEHLPDDMKVLRDLYTMLARDGVLLLTVPAHKSLWSYFDERSHHYRRYELAELEGELISAGYKVEYISHYMASIFPLVWLGRRFYSLKCKRRAGDANLKHDRVLTELKVVPIVNNLLALWLGQEARLIARRHRLPIGTSILAIARKE